jgi:hypothetical protein
MLRSAWMYESSHREPILLMRPTGAINSYLRAAPPRTPGYFRFGESNQNHLPPRLCPRLHTGSGALTPSVASGGAYHTTFPVADAQARDPSLAPSGPA